MSGVEKWCPKCAVIAKGVFCNKCGEKLLEIKVGEKVCSKCRAIREGRFCNVCGQDLHLQAQVQVQEKPAKRTKKGHCFILTNFEFPNGGILGYQIGEDANLYGYKRDADNIKETFNSLNFIVLEKENTNTADMKEALQEWCNIDFTDEECIVVFILSHGGEHGFLYGCDGTQIHIDEIISKFHSCEQLKGKPKLFFIQACRGELSPPVESTIKKCGPRLSRGSKFHETFVYYCTGEGYAGFVSNETGSVFISQLCEILKQYGRQYKLWELVTKVNKMVSETVFRHGNENVAQCPEAVYSLSSDFCFGEHTAENENDTVDGACNKLVECVELKQRNPCFILSNTECDTHKLQCIYFKQYKQEAVKTFSDLNFDVHEKDNLKGSEIIELFKNLKKFKNLKESECLVCVVLSCGGLSDHMPIIYGADGIFCSIGSITRKVIGIKDLIGKPKIFFMVLKRCNRDLYRKAGKSNELQECKSQGTDTFIYYVIIEEDNHSVFISTLCEVLLDYSSKGYHIGDVVFKVNKLMHELQSSVIPEVCSTLTRLVSFKHVRAGQQSEDNPDIIFKSNFKMVTDSILKNASHDDSERISGSGGITMVLEDSDIVYENSDATGSDNDLQTDDTIDDHTKTNRSNYSPQDQFKAFEDSTTNINRDNYSSQDQMFQSHNETDDSKTTTTAEPNVHVTNLSELSFGERDELTKMLEYGSNNWKDFGMVLVEQHGGEILEKDEVGHLCRDDDGSPAKEFLRLMSTQQPECKLHTFSEVANGLKRKDIANHINQWPDWDTKLLIDINGKQSKSLICLLDKKINNDWRNFADKFKFKVKTIKELAQIAKDNPVSPAEKLIELIDEKFPNFKLSDFHEILVNITRIDVADALNTIIVSHGGTAFENRDVSANQSYDLR